MPYTNTSHGYKKPNDGTTGFWDKLNENTDQLNSHNHDGLNSEKLGPQASVGLEQVIPPVPAWVVVDAPSSSYSKDITIPVALTLAALTFDTVNISIRSAAGDILPLKVQKLTATTFRVFSNDNTLALKVVYTT